MAWTAPHAPDGLCADDHHTDLPICSVVAKVLTAEARLGRKRAFAALWAKAPGAGRSGPLAYFWESLHCGYDACGYHPPKLVRVPDTHIEKILTFRNE